MKKPVCKICGGEHYQTFCPKAPKKPIKKTSIKSSKVKKVNVAKCKKPKTAKPKSISRKKLVKQLDTVFSQYIRLRDETEGCVTCGTVKPYKEMQCGHFYTRGRFPTRWNEDNCHTQCYRCNCILNGNYINYTRYMIDRYGREFVDNLEKTSLSAEKISTENLKYLINVYKDLVKTLLH